MDYEFLPESTKECIRIFESAIERCKNGEILECLVMTQDTDGTMSYRMSESYNFYAMCGYFDQFKFDVMQRNNKEQECGS